VPIEGPKIGKECLQVRSSVLSTIHRKDKDILRTRWWSWEIEERWEWGDHSVQQYWKGWSQQNNKHSSQGFYAEPWGQIITVQSLADERMFTLKLGAQSANFGFNRWVFLTHDTIYLLKSWPTFTGVVAQKCIPSKREISEIRAQVKLWRRAKRLTRLH